MLGLVCLLLVSGTGRADLSDWVVEVDGGMEEALRLADRTQTDLLAEILPGSNLFQLRERRREKRETGERLERILTEDRRVKSFSHQTALKASDGRGRQFQHQLDDD